MRNRNIDVDFTLTGDNTEEILQKVEENINVALKQIGEAIEGYAKEDCPVDTGLLRNSLTYAVAGQSAAISSYHASYGSNRGADGKRHSASSKNAGSVNIGRYSGAVGDASDQAVYVGSNVEYAPAVEFKDMGHKVGKAHFLRDAGYNHTEEYKEIAEKILKRM